MLRIKFLAIILISLFILMLLLQSCQQKSDKLKIGVISPFSGNGAVYGQALKDGFAVALDDISKEHPDVANKIELIYEDDKLDAGAGVAALHKLVNSDKVPVVIGAFTSGVTLAIAPVAEKSKVVLITPTATNYKIKDAGDYIFRTCPSDTLQGSDLAKFAINNLKKKTACILYLNTDYGVGLKATFQEAFEKLGGKILSSEGFAPDATDFRTTLTKVRQLKPDIVYMPSNWKEAVNLINQSKELNINTQFLCTDGTYDPLFLQNTKGSSEGVIITTMSFASGKYKEQAESFKQKFMSKFGKEPGAYSALCYDTLMVVVNTILSNGFSADKIKSRLYKAYFIGATGLTKFDSFGEVDKKFEVYQVKDNKFEPIPNDK